MESRWGPWSIHWVMVGFLVFRGIPVGALVCPLGHGGGPGLSVGSPWGLACLWSPVGGWSVCGVQVGAMVRLWGPMWGLGMSVGSWWEPWTLCGVPLGTDLSVGYRWYPRSVCGVPVGILVSPWGPGGGWSVLEVPVRAAQSAESRRGLWSVCWLPVGDHVSWLWVPSPSTAGWGWCRGSGPPGSPPGQGLWEERRGSFFWWDACSPAFLCPVDRSAGADLPSHAGHSATRPLLTAVRRTEQRTQRTREGRGRDVLAAGLEPDSCRPSLAGAPGQCSAPAFPGS